MTTGPSHAGQCRPKSFTGAVLPKGWRIRQRVAEDHAAIRDLLRRAYPPPHGSECIWSLDALSSHLERFPVGQMVLLDGHGRLRGTSTTLRTSPEQAFSPHTWSEITGRGTLSTHQPEGSVLYGVNIAIDPAWQGHGLGRALYHARFSLGRELGCTAFAAGARIPGFHLQAHRMTVGEYIAKVVRGELFDPTLSRQLALGFEVIGELPDYAYDHETLGHAALIVKPLGGQP